MPTATASENARQMGVYILTLNDVPYVKTTREEIFRGAKMLYEQSIRSVSYRMPVVMGSRFDIRYLNFGPAELSAAEVELVVAERWELYPASLYHVESALRFRPNLAEFFRMEKSGIVAMERVPVGGHDRAWGFGWSKKTPREIALVSFTSKMLEHTWFAFVTRPWNFKY